MRASRFITTLTTLLLASAPFMARAEIVSYKFSASVWDMFTDSSSVYTTINETNLPGALISMGDHITGQITYDTSAAPDWVGADGKDAVYNYAVKSLAFKFDATGLEYKSDGDVSLTNIHTPTDIYYFSTLGFFTSNYALAGRPSGSLDLADFSATALNSLSLPSQLSLAAFPSSSLSYVWAAPDQSVTLYVTANLDTLTNVSAIPEPATWSLFVIGAAALMGLARRRHGV
jgi:hypothetical protein